jgi:hypothetical protein
MKIIFVGNAISNTKYSVEMRVRNAIRRIPKFSFSRILRFFANRDSLSSQNKKRVRQYVQVVFRMQQQQHDTLQELQVGNLQAMQPCVIYGGGEVSQE